MSGGAPTAPAARSLEWARQAMSAVWLRPPPPATAGPAPGGGAAAAGEPRFAGAEVDSRRVRPGMLFFALPGARADGFAFCRAAADAGAVALVVAAARGAPPDAGAAFVLGVEDPLRALADLARAARAGFGGRVVGVTGSNGKTTTKELTAAALAAAGPVLRTEGNYNTEIGLPLTILSARGHERFWVLEMAMRGRGQIALLADIARPHVGVITNVAGAHLELLGSIEEVARAKGELFAALGDGGVAVLPAGDRLIEAQAAHLAEGQKVRFDAGDGGGPGVPPGAAGGDPLDVRVLEALMAGADGQVVRYAVRRQPVVARLPLAGMHNAQNGAAALAVATALGVPAPAAAAALAATKLPPHRSAPLGIAGRIVLDDCYNANPASMRAALATVAASSTGAGAGARAFAILGDMLEIGPDEAAEHRALGREAAALLAGLVAVGPRAADIVRGAADAGLPAARLHATDDPAAAAAHLAPWTQPGDWILVKASRGMRLERAIEALASALSPAPAPAAGG